MLTFIHNYNKQYVHGLFKHDMIRPSDGFKITQHYLTPNDMRFNTVAAKDGELYALAKETASCFYVDRIQGGTFISKYPFDLRLAREYDDITNGGFLGFQLHESATTRSMDWARIQRQLKATGLDYNYENILYVVALVSHDKKSPHFSSGFPEEYAALTPPLTLTQYVDDLLNLWKKRQKEYEGRVLNCDANTMLCGIESEVKIKNSFIEVGAQSAYARTQFALRRGISRAGDKKWGVYIEPWGGAPISAYLFKRDATNEWYIDGKTFLFKATDGNGGSSMSLAKRIMYYSLFSGANYFAEEWGQANTFYEWDNYALSPYGIIKRDFLKDVARFKKVKPYVPIAFVIPREHKYFSTNGAYPAFVNDMVEDLSLWKKINDYFDDGIYHGDEDQIFVSGKCGSLFDIIYDNSYDNPKKEYELLVDFSGRLSGENIVNGYNKEKTEKAIKEITEKLPFVVNSNVGLDYQIFTDGEEKYVVLYNHKGVTKTQENGEIKNANATARYTIRGKDGRLLRRVDLSGENGVEGILSAGEIALYQL